MQIIEQILGRRKLKRGYEYEVQWKGQPLDKNEWLTRDQLEEMGWAKALNEIDIKEAAKQGLVSRPLTGRRPLPRRQRPAFLRLGCCGATPHSRPGGRELLGKWIASPGHESISHSSAVLGERLM